MSIKNLAALSNPYSVAIIGASTRQDAIGSKILRNVIDGGFSGEVWPVNPKYSRIVGRRCFRDVAALPQAPDIAVIATPARTVAPLVHELGEKGTKVAVIVTGNLNNELRHTILEASKPYGLRIFGPNVVGLILPEARLNLSFVLTGAQTGKIGLISQSGAIVSSLLDWACDHSIGFSKVLSLGDMIDVDAGDAIDFLAADHQTTAIVMYLESIPNPRKFISAARAAGRQKPLIAIVPGRHLEAAKAAMTHTGALIGNARIIDAVLRRAGIIPVKSLSELLAAAEITQKVRPAKSLRVGIVTNGGGAGVLAVDSLLDRGECLATLSDQTINDLDRILSTGWSRSNPVDVLGDATPAQIAEAIKIAARDPNVDAVLALHCPVRAAEPIATAAAVVSAVQTNEWRGKPLLACLLGGRASRQGRLVLRAAGIPDYGMPDDAIAALHILGEWGRRQDALTHIATTFELEANRSAARQLMEAVARQSRTMLTEAEAKTVLRSYQIPVAECSIAGNVAAVGPLAAMMLRKHQSIVVKLLSRSITHKSELGGVALDIHSRVAACRAARDMQKRVNAAGLETQIDGFVVEPMIEMENGIELFAGLSVDPVFGPVIAFGAGGIAIEQLDDVAVSLPPLDDALAADLISQTRVSRLLRGFRHVRPANMDAIRKTLLALSQIAIDFPFIRAIDINPLAAGNEVAVAMDARIEIDLLRLNETAPNRNLVIKPYPGEWTERISLNDQAFTLRPIRPMDAHAYSAMLERTSPSDTRARFFGQTKLSNATVVRMTHIDYEREMAFVATDIDGQIVGVARLAIDDAKESGDFGLLVRSDRQRIGLGRILLRKLVDFANAQGLKEIRGSVLPDNFKMLNFCRKVGFAIAASSGDVGLRQVQLSLPDRDLSVLGDNVPVPQAHAV
ncbi:bifunctional acetate--CoA ligase family protein/GNAT family N-acetyltransferase [Rhizobium sp. P40RR-XXII]|uniref:bifunctional acetate--CoA ligase family protein/GNAT family N-acetyltransferase n=1 Tax=Rhizobium sp. P40RR-XXII TaxID=2726739 RepID=UPI0014568CC5|nr:bifunctional acetate--CoA ligase family protein/GNAT family N-acetyltransferase [Rhizobium sp. P40RR-XXII]NLS20405.1 bifunctional acetate--CoA ligase family protein/GNAT family N-acetyltransferase [Rhizobium sp. P40RR-XXII]